MSNFLSDLTEAQIKEKIRQHFTNDPRFGWNNDVKVCTYLSPDGRKCAIGCLFPDEVAASLPAAPWPDVVPTFPKYKSPHHELLVLAQRSHDEYAASYFGGSMHPSDITETEAVARFLADLEFI